MATRFHVGTNRPTKCLNLHVSSISLLPKSYHDAFNDPNLQNAIHDEYHALIKNQTWILVPRPTTVTLILLLHCGIFTNKFLAVALSVVPPKVSLVEEIGSISKIEGLNVDEPLACFLIQECVLNGDYLETVLYASATGFSETLSIHASSETVFLGMSCLRGNIAVELLEQAHCDLICPILIGLLLILSLKLGSDGDPVSDPTLYRSLACSLQYLTFIPPGYILCNSSDWLTLPRSSAKAYYYGVPNVVAEICWLRNLLRELHTPLSSATLVYGRFNISNLDPSIPSHQRKKHIEIDIHFVRDLVPAGHVQVLHVSCHYQFADIFTKRLPLTLFEEFRSSF
ncbi:ribonuclease H-like domain-containing protein [Tanacetum coccineum]